MESMAVHRVPLEILELIFGYLGVQDRLAASSVCKRWYSASLNINLWKDAAVRISVENTSEGMDVLKYSERPFSCFVFEECCISEGASNTLFCQALEMFKVVGQHLNVLHFQHCAISGSHLAEILVRCPNLQHLSAIDCESVFSSGAWLMEDERVDLLKSSLQNVKELDLSCNKSLSDFYFTHLTQLFTNLRSLSLTECLINFQALIVKRFYPRPDFKPSDNILTFSFIKKFISRNSTRITSVNFSGTAIDDAALRKLACVKGLQLECISLSRCLQLSAAGIGEFCRYQKNLKKLDLPILITLDDVLPEICSNLFKLRELRVGKTWRQEKASLVRALELQALNKLVKLDLDSCCEVIVLKFIDCLRSEAFPKLRHLSLYNDKVDDCSFVYMIPYLLQITYLDLGGTLITDRVLIMISTHLVHLQVLKLSQCGAITDKGIVGRLETASVSERRLVMEDSEGLSFGNRDFLKWLVFDEDNPVPLSNLKGLRELDLDGIRGIGDDGIKVALVFRELRYLRLGGSSKITDEGIFTVGKNNRCLEVLSLRSLTGVTETGIAKILSYLPRLKLLDVQDCSKLRRTVLSDLVKCRFKLTYLF